jgi:hypothetical protein
LHAPPHQLPLHHFPPFLRPIRDHQDTPPL